VSAHEARRALSRLVSGDDDAIDLPRAALLIAAEEYPDLDVERYLARLSELGRLVRERVGTAPDTEHRLAALNELLFGEEGFRGNTASYYDPRNSYLNEVLDRRLGIPITLSLVYVEVGKRAGLPLYGIGMPSHFIVGCDGLLIDPFNCGRRISQADCQELLRQAFGASFVLEPAHLARITPRNQLGRMINNLKVAYQQLGDLPRALRSAEQLAVVLPSASDERELVALRMLHERRN
jgi:regulator of sirC expression with transglutaminase-like and TPR domain